MLSLQEEARLSGLLNSSVDPLVLMQPFCG